MTENTQINTCRHLQEHIEIFMCPSCSGDLKIETEVIQCAQCSRKYPVEDGIPLLFYPHDGSESKEDVTETVKAFYEKTPFPDYEDLDNVGALIQKAQNSIFAKLLNEQLPFNIRILEVGCGTGQLSNFLGASHRHIFGTDLCLNSLKLARDFKERSGLDRNGFYQMNLFRPIFKEESFPVVICSGVLHHTSDPLGGFQSIAKLVKKGGFIIVGLYNTYGRLITDMRRSIFNITGDRLKFLDPRLRGNDRGLAKRTSWFNDQYKHPHESKHTMGETLKWFDSNGFDFIYGIPQLKAFEGNKLDDAIFKPHPAGNWLDHLMVQSKMTLLGSREGGFYIMIGKKR